MSSFIIFASHLFMFALLILSLADKPPRNLHIELLIIFHEVKGRTRIDLLVNVELMRRQELITFEDKVSSRVTEVIKTCLL